MTVLGRCPCLVILTLAFLMTLSCALVERSSTEIQPASDRALPTPIPITPVSSRAVVAGSEGLAVVNEAYSRLQESNSSRSFNLSFKSGGGGEAYVDWEVRYTDIVTSEANLRARGSATDYKTGVSFEFYSMYSSTCLKQTYPEELPWEYVLHHGWVPGGYNQDVWTPLLPVAFFDIRPAPTWTLSGFADPEMVVTEGTSQVGSVRVIFAVYVDTNTSEIRRIDAIFEAPDGSLDGVRTVGLYSDYGSDVVAVHEDTADCLSRNE